jgi:hypothetical protein
LFEIAFDRSPASTWGVGDFAHGTVERLPLRSSILSHLTEEKGLLDLRRHRCFRIVPHISATHGPGEPEILPNSDAIELFSDLHATPMRYDNFIEPRSIPSIPNQSNHPRRRGSFRVGPGVCFFMRTMSTGIGEAAARLRRAKYVSRPRDPARRLRSLECARLI